MQLSLFDVLVEHSAQVPDVSAEENIALYLAKIGRQPVESKLRAADEAYLTGPLVCADSSWGADLPAWLRASVVIGRQAMVVAGEQELAAQEEALAYLMTASLAAPLAREWAEIFFWLAAQVLPRWGNEIDVWAALGCPPVTLDRMQESDLRRLQRDIRASVVRHGQKRKQ